MSGVKENYFESGNHFLDLFFESDYLESRMNTSERLFLRKIIDNSRLQFQKIISEAIDEKNNTNVIPLFQDNLSNTIFIARRYFDLRYIISYWFNEIFGSLCEVNHPASIYLLSQYDGFEDVEEELDDLWEKIVPSQIS